MDPMDAFNDPNAQPRPYEHTHWALIEKAMNHELLFQAKEQLNLVFSAMNEHPQVAAIMADPSSALVAQCLGAIVAIMSLFFVTRTLYRLGSQRLMLGAFFIGALASVPGIEKAVPAAAAAAFDAATVAFHAVTPYVNGAATSASSSAAEVYRVAIPYVNNAASSASSSASEAYRVAMPYVNDAVGSAADAYSAALAHPRVDDTFAAAALAYDAALANPHVNATLTSAGEAWGALVDHPTVRAIFADVSPWTAHTAHPQFVPLAGTLGVLLSLALLRCCCRGRGRKQADGRGGKRRGKAGREAASKTEGGGR